MSGTFLCFLVVHFVVRAAAIECIRIVSRCFDYCGRHDRETFVNIDGSCAFQVYEIPAYNRTKGNDAAFGVKRAQHNAPDRIVRFVETGFSFIDDTIDVIRRGIELWNEDPVDFAHRVYGSTYDFIKREGYPVEMHNVTTPDGFRLVMFRIPYGKKSNNTEGRAPVLVVHGILCSSTDWVISGANNSLAFLLADGGYDVWLANVRGNTYSRTNVKYNEFRHKKEYWDFCWHEMGIYDMPTSIDYVLSKTHHTQLYYIAHSMGTTIFYVMCSERPQYNKKVKAMISLAPIAYMNHVRSRFMRFLSTISDPVAWLFNTMGFYEFRPGGKFLLYAGQIVCQRNTVTKNICDNALFLIAGYDTTQLNKTSLPMILAHSPAGASSKQLTHYSQLIRKERWFGRYDHGTAGNLMKYGSPNPPKYDLSKIKVPITLMYSKDDWLSSYEDVQALAQDLPNVYEIFEVPVHPFNHLDFIWAVDAKVLVYDESLRILNHFNKNN